MVVLTSSVVAMAAAEAILAKLRGVRPVGAKAILKPFGTNWLSSSISCRCSSLPRKVETASTTPSSSHLQSRCEATPRSRGRRWSAKVSLAYLKWRG
jgi:hypothetical protein